MSQHLGPYARFRRALGRPMADQARGDDLLSGDVGLTADLRALPEAVQRKIESSSTDSLIDLIRAEDARVEANRALVGYMVQVIAGRLGGLAAAREAGVPEWALSMIDRGKQPDDTHLFVGWLDADGDIAWQDRSFHPTRSTDIPPEMVRRIEKREACGGVFGRCDDREVQGRAERLRRTMDKWRGRRLQALGPVAGETVLGAVHSIASNALRRFLEADALEADACMLALDGKQVVLLSATGDVHKLSKKETNHLALKGLIPHNPPLPLHWWKDKQVQEDQEQDDKKGRGRVRVYKGKFDDEQEVGFEEDKEGYGE